MIGNRHSQVEGGHATRIGKHRRDHNAGDSQGRRPLMALQTNIPAIEAWLSRGMYVQSVEDEALLVERSQLNNAAALHRSDRRPIVEKDRARRAGADLRRLKAGLREDQHLGISVNVEALEDAGKPSVLPVIFECGLPEREIADQA